MTSTQREVFNCVLSGDLKTITEHFEREGVTGESEEEDVFGMKDEAGRNALLTACVLGRSAIVRELVRTGARVEERTVRGESEERGASSRLHPGKRTTLTLIIAKHYFQST